MKQKNKPVRVLHILTGLTTGGAESFILNMYRNIDRSKVQFDFLLRSNDNIYKNELHEMGSQIYVTASFPRHFIRNMFQTSAFFKAHQYDIIHVHANALLYTYALRCAKRNGVKCRIIHSHNTAMAHKYLLPIHAFNKNRIQTLATDYFACSKDAGKWMFNSEYIVTHNAIDLDIFSFSPQKREIVRNNLAIADNETVLGHIGRFTDQKNHSFLIDIFAEAIKTKPDMKLVLIGDGELRKNIEKKVTDLNLSSRVIFLGARKDIAEIIHAFDLFVLPSKYEGWPVVAVEAQANGLKLVCSEAVPEQLLFDKSMCRLSLNDDLPKWTSSILSMKATRLQLTSSLQNAGYEIKQEAQKLQDFYLSKTT